MNQDISKETEKKILDLQLLEQNLQNNMLQKQRFQVELLETENALSEIEKSKEAFKIIGNIMIPSKKEDLKKELDSKKKILDLRIKNLEKEESQLKERASELQKEVLGEIKNERRNT